jgi:hypothetical protein
MIKIDKLATCLGSHDRLFPWQQAGEFALAAEQERDAPGIAGPFILGVRAIL